VHYKPIRTLAPVAKYFSNAAFFLFAALGLLWLYKMDLPAATTSEQNPPTLQSQVPEEVKSVFAALDNLSPPGIWSKPVVRQQNHDAATSPLNRNAYTCNGLLIEHSQEMVSSVWNPRLKREELASRTNRNDAGSSKSLVVVSLQDQIRFLRASINNQNDHLRPPEIYAIFWARVAHEQNEFTLRDELIELTRSLLNDKPLSQLVEETIPREVYHGIIQGFEDPKLSRDMILAELERFVMVFPTFRQTKQAAVLRDDVKSLIQEDSNRSNRSELLRLSKRDRIAELIHQLCDQSTNSLFSMHKPGIANRAKLAKGEPCWQLYELGYDTVPQLIEAMSDSRPSRVVERTKIFSNNIRVLSIGECAETILQMFVDRHFESQIGSTAERQNAYRQWYSDVESRGVLSFLIQSVEKGGPGIEPLAYSLSIMNLEAAMQSIPIGIEQTTQPRDRHLLYVVMNSLGKEGVNYLREQLTRETDSELRLRIEAMIAGAQTDQ
jgi:hypothetical protein